MFWALSALLGAASPSSQGWLGAGSAGALSSQHLLRWVLVEPGMETRASGIPELGLDAGQKLLWHFLSSPEPRRPAHASLAPVCQGRAFPRAVLSHAEELHAARGG